MATIKPCAGTSLATDNTDIPCDDFVSTECVIHEDALVELGLPENSNSRVIINAILNSLINLNNQIGDIVNPGIEVLEDGTVVLSETLKLNFIDDINASIDGTDPDRVNISVQHPDYSVTFFANTLRLFKDGDVISTVDLSSLLDNTNLSRIISGEVLGTDLVLTRNDSTVIIVDTTPIIEAATRPRIISGVVSGATLTLTREDSTTIDIDVSTLLDDTNLARTVSGELVGTNIVMTRDDSTTFSIDVSNLLDDTNLSRITSGASSTSTLTLYRDDASTIDIDVTALYQVAADIEVEFTPVSYTPLDNSVEEHLKAMDGIISGTGLELVTEGSNSGWRLIGQDPAFHGNIGNNAIDFTVLNSTSGAGALGDYAFAAGSENIASGIGAVAFGFNNTASGSRSFTTGSSANISSGNESFTAGFQNVASGNRAFSVNTLGLASGASSATFGVWNFARRTAEMSIGEYGTDYTPTGTNDRLFNVGIGTNDSTRNDGITVFKSGLVTAPSITNALIDGGSVKSLTSKEWVLANSARDADEVNVSPAVNALTNVQSVLEDHESRIDALASGGSDGAVTDVDLIGTDLIFTGSGTAFNGTIDLSTIGSGGAYTGGTGIDITSSVISLDTSSIASLALADTALQPSDVDAIPTDGNTGPVSSGGMFDALEGKQDTLVSGTNIKTVGGLSLLGSGNISVDQLYNDGSYFNNTSYRVDVGSYTAASDFSSFTFDDGIIGLYVDSEPYFFYKKSALIDAALDSVPELYMNTIYQFWANGASPLYVYFDPLDIFTNVSPDYFVFKVHALGFPSDVSGSFPLPYGKALGSIVGTGGGTSDGLGPDGDVGDATIGGSGTTLTINGNAITNAKMSNVATGTFKGRITAGTGVVEDLSATQATSMLGLFSSTLKGLVPASGGGTTNFLRADGSWQPSPTTSGLVLLDEGNGPGWRLYNANPSNFGDIGNHAIDISKSESASTTSGATGSNSFAGGQDSRASGFGSFSYSNFGSALGNWSVMFGSISNANGNSSFVANVANTAQSYAESVFGTYSTNYTALSTTAWEALDRLFNIGNGTDAERSDALTVLKNGTVTFPSLTIAQIDAAGAKAAVTKEKLDAEIAAVSAGAISTDNQNKINNSILPPKTISKNDDYNLVLNDARMTTSGNSDLGRSYVNEVNDAGTTVVTVPDLGTVDEIWRFRTFSDSDQFDIVPDTGVVFDWDGKTTENAVRLTGIKGGLVYMRKTATDNYFFDGDITGFTYTPPSSSLFLTPGITNAENYVAATYGGWLDGGTGTTGMTESTDDPGIGDCLTSIQWFRDQSTGTTFRALRLVDYENHITDYDDSKTYKLSMYINNTEGRSVRVQAENQDTGDGLLVVSSANNGWELVEYTWKPATAQTGGDIIIYGAYGQAVTFTLRVTEVTITEV